MQDITEKVTAAVVERNRRVMTRADRVEEACSIIIKASTEVGKKEIDALEKLARRFFDVMVANA